MNALTNAATHDFAPVPYLSPAVQRGVGFFEAALLVGRRAVLWEPHVTRMVTKLPALDLPAPTRDEMEAAALRAVNSVSPRPAEQRALRLNWFAIADDL